MLKNCFFATLAASAVFAAVLQPFATALLADEPAAKAPAFKPADREFYEKKVKPLLEARCFSCHGPKAKVLKGGLRLDSRTALLKGGDTGPAAVPGKPEKSLMIEAVNYSGLEMPPRTKLPAGEIAILTKWVKLGLPVSKGSGKPLITKKEEAFPLQQRKRSHWAWQSVTNPALPDVRNRAWAVTPIDRFLLAKLEAKGLSPNPAADRASLIRRAYFDLTGLPPAPKDVAEFVNDPAPTRKAFETVVDRLLKSPRYGERWARHWLDLMRYAESLGHEFDYPLHHAHQYRDYVIRAFNADVPYNQFVTEHIAGDRLKTPRRHPELDYNESVIGTGFWFLGEDKHSPVDVKGEEAGKIDNQIDVFSKTFLGLTLACARCHDHKFDAMSQKDYVALHGFLQSSRRHKAWLDPHRTIEKKTAELAKLYEQGNALLQKNLRKTAADRTNAEIVRYLLASREVLVGSLKPTDTVDVKATNGKTHRPVNTVAEEFGVDPDRLKHLVSTLQSNEVNDVSHSLWLWKQLALTTDADFAKQQAVANRKFTEAAPRPAATNTKLFADFNGKGFSGWFPEGFAFGTGATQPGDWDSAAKSPTATIPGVVDSGRYSNRLCGVLRSPTFTITHDHILYRVKGDGGGRIRLIIDGYVMDEFNGLLFQGCLFDVKTGGKWTWFRQTGHVHNYKGRSAHIEIIDDGHGTVAVDEIRFANAGDPTPKDGPSVVTRRILQDRTVRSVRTLAERYAGEITASLAKSGHDGLLEVATQTRLLISAKDSEFADLTKKMQAIAATVPDPIRVLSITDGSPEDEHLFIRGSHKNPGPIVHRRMLEAISGADQSVIKNGSGRLELANRLLAPSNPFPARVMVNRLWHHLTGRGIVGSIDNFGVLGQTPTHPELLDHLATTFTQDRWSIKRAVRRIMLSNTYMMSSTPNPAAEKVDPENLLLHRMRIRRLEGEAIRDSILAVSGRLNVKMHGESVPVFLTRFMQGRGRPRRSGPLDGNGRRSLYIAVRRNFLSPMMLAFDTPIPFTAIGRRNVSNVPAQALILMNDPFVVQQANLWAKQVLAEKTDSPQDRIRSMYQTAFSRDPTKQEIADAVQFLQTQTAALGLKADDWKSSEPVWSDFAHVLFNVKEFIYVR